MFGKLCGAFRNDAEKRLPSKQRAKPSRNKVRSRTQRINFNCVLAVQQNRAKRRRLVKGKLTVYFDGVKKQKNQLSSNEEG
jgi:hypothetical protein